MSWYLTPKLNNKVDVLYKEDFYDKKTGVKHNDYVKIKSVFADIRNTRRRTREGKAETDYAIDTYEIITRERSIPELDETYRFRYKNRVYKIFSVEYDYNRRGHNLCHCERVLE